MVSAIGLGAATGWFELAGGGVAQPDKKLVITPTQIIGRIEVVRIE
jgi:hypothetical protein